MSLLNSQVTERQPAHQFSFFTSIWLARKLDMLPVATLGLTLFALN